MRFLQPGLAILLMGVATPILALPAFAQTCACPTTDGFAPGPVIEAEEPPPPLPVYEQPPLPAPGHVWTPGYWAWNNSDYYWVPGVWAPPPRPNVLWTPGYWAFVGGVYLFHQGYWGPHVGFYGGVNYGFGYNGLGYEGGRWEANRFVYNTTVNNFGGVHVTNVYTQPVPVAPGAGRASFNGGPGGIALRPTPEQARLTTEEHIRPTPVQLAHARAASMDPMQFHSANQGKPAVAATARPGELKGPGVMPATAAGSAAIAPGAPGEPQRLAPGEKPPESVPGLERKTPAGATLAPGEPQRLAPGEKPGAPAQTPLGEKPVKTETPALAKPAPDKAPGVPVEREGGAKPPAPKPEAKPEPPKPAAAVPAPGGERPRPEAGPGGERPRPETGPGGAPKGEPAAAERKPPRPEGKERACGGPGEPPCR